MNKKYSIITSFIFLFSHVSITLAEDLPEGTVQSGTLTSETLMGDTMKGVASKVDMQGCKKPDSFLAYISRLPEGEAGARTWEEKWIVYGCESSYTVVIEFNENGTDAATFKIR